MLLIATALNDGTQSEDERWDAAQDRLDELQAGLAQPAEAFLAQVDLGTPVTATPRITPDAFRTAVARAKDHITAGDVFQVVISQRFDHEVTADPIDVYRVLRTLNPSPYMYLLSLEDTDGEPYWIIGSSPEALGEGGEPPGLHASDRRLEAARRVPGRGHRTGGCPLPR